jgi:hypothetical protein
VSVVSDRARVTPELQELEEEPGAASIVEDAMFGAKAGVRESLEQALERRIHPRFEAARKYRIAPVVQVEIDVFDGVNGTTRRTAPDVKRFVAKSANVGPHRGTLDGVSGRLGLAAHDAPDVRRGPVNL